MGNRHRAVSMSFNGNVSKDDEMKTQQSLADLRSVYKDVRYDWPQLVQGEVLPLELAIAFLDDTSVGLAHRKDEFDELCQHTAESLRAAVVENHDTFNNSVGLYHLLLSMAKKSQEDSTHIKDLIDTSTRDMKDRSGYLKDLDNSSTKYAEMIEILDAMEELHNLPEQIDKLITEKRIHEVYDVIAEGYKTAAKYNLWSLSAMNATQVYLEMQSNNLYDMIVEELKNEIYLKNIPIIGQGKDSWSNLIDSNQPQIASFRRLLGQLTTLELYIYNSANLDIQEISECFTDPIKFFLESQLPKLHAHYSKHDNKIDYSILLESALNPATESLYYMYMLLSTASKLNRLEPVLEILATTVQLELHSLINQTTAEIKLKNYAHLARIAKVQSYEKATAYDKLSGQTFSDASVPILQDLFGTFFIKCLVVLLKHKIVCEIVQLIQSGRNLSSPTARNSATDASSSTYDFKNVWEILKKEINNFTLSYIYEDDERTQAKGDHGYAAGKVQLAKNKIFNFDDVSYESSTNSDKLTHVLDGMFPGFSISARKSSGNESSPYISSERYNTLVEILVPKNIFNMRIILEFLLIFTAGSHQLFTDFDKNKGTSMIAYQYFYEFMKSSFLKKLQEELNKSLDESMGGDEYSHLRSDSTKGLIDFDQSTVAISDPGIIQKVSNTKHEIYSNALKFKQIFTHACHTMNTSFAYRRDYSDTVLHLLRRFAKCYEDSFRELLSTGGSHDITEMRFGLESQTMLVLQLNKWMRIPALMETTGSILQNYENPENCKELVDKEIEVMFFHSESSEKIFELTKEDFFDDDWFNQVCNFLLTATWILGWLPSMRKESNYSIYNSDDQKVSEIEKLKYDYSFLENGRSSYGMSERALHEYLTLSLDKVSEFDSVIEIFASIRDNSLIALRYDVRLKALYHIGKSYQDNFVLPTEPADADQFVSLFNKELYYIGTKINDVLSIEEKECVFSGLPSFINKAFLQGSENIMIANGNGIKRILLNVLTLQQMLRSVLRQQSSVDLSKASKYFEMFTVSEHQFMQKVTENREGFTKTEILNLLRLVYSEKLATSNASSFNRTRYNELARKINEVF